MATRIFICFSSLVVDLTRPIGPGLVDVYLSVIYLMMSLPKMWPAPITSPSTPLFIPRGNQKLRFGVTVVPGRSDGGNDHSDSRPRHPLQALGLLPAEPAALVLGKGSEALRNPVSPQIVVVYPSRAVPPRGPAQETADRPWPDGVWTPRPCRCEEHRIASRIEPE